MALKMYLDAACTVEALLPQVFTGDGAQTAFALDTANHPSFTGAKVGSVYLESAVSHVGITFADGVGTGFSGLTVNALIGQRVIHNGTFRGTVVSNATTTVTISDDTYTNGTASACLISAYAKQPALAYTVTGDTVTMDTAPTITQKLHILPLDTNMLALNFGGTQGTVKTTSGSFWLRRSPLSSVPGASLNVYINLLVQALDNSQTQATATQTGITFTAGVGAGFSGLVAGALVGRALIHNGTYRGLVTANTTTTVTIDDTGYDEATEADATIFTIGSLVFAPDSAGSPGAYAPVLQPADITSDTAVRVWVKDTITVPASAMNYPNQRPRVLYSEGLA